MIRKPKLNWAGGVSCCVFLMLAALGAGCGSGDGTTQGSAGQPAQTFFNAFLASAQIGPQTGQTNSISASHSIWPVDTAVMPAPTVFLATDSNCLSDSDLPNERLPGVVVSNEGANRFAVLVTQVDKVGAVQQTPTLCWAACTQTLLGQRGISVDQVALGKEYEPVGDDDDDDQTAGVGVVIRALNPDLEPQVEQRGAIPIDLYPVTSDQLVTELLAGHLCVVGLVEDREDNMGHACVVCGATFAKLKPGLLSGTVAKNPNVPALDEAALQSNLAPVYGLYSVELWDPEPKVGHRTLTAQQFCDQAAFITSHDISHEILLSALQAAPDVVPRPGQIQVKSKTYIAKERRQKLIQRKNKPASASNVQNPPKAKKPKAQDTN